MTPTSNGTRPTGERLPPADLDAEQGLLGALLMSSLAQWESVAHVEPSDFQKPAHQLVFEAIRTVWRTHATCDAVLVSAELRKMGLLDTVGGPAYLIELQAVTPSISHAPKYASVIITAAASRRMIHLAGQLSELGHDPGMDTADMFDRARQLLADNERALLAGEITTSTPYLSDLFHGDWQPPDWVVPGMLAAGHRMMIAGKGGAGKALDVSTPIPTPNGFRPMGDLARGDWVFGADGRQVQVIGATDVMHDRECVRVEFQTGASLVADIDHQWTIRRRNGRYAGRMMIVTTGDLVVGDSVPCAGPTVTSSVDLPMDPYTLGVWLGDGTTTGPTLTLGDPDAAAITERIKAGGGVRLEPHAKKGGSTTFQMWNAELDRAWEHARRLHLEHPTAGTRALARATGLHHDSIARRMPTVSGDGRHVNLGRVDHVLGIKDVLRSFGVLGNKHIPDLYLSAGTDQRMDLMRGLIDTDGHVAPDGRVEFCTTRKELADGFVLLAASLGYKTRSVESDAVLNGRVVGRRWRFHFAPADMGFGFPALTPRRLDPMVAASRDRNQTGWVRVTSITPVASRPVRCIQVGAVDGLYLAGEHHTVTHNSSFLRQFCLSVAAGFHPFRGDARNLYPIDAQPVLVVDLENDGPAWTAETRVMHDFLAAKAGVARLPIKVHALGGARYDPVGNRADRADLFARCHENRPRLLMFGPIYKLDQLGGDEGWHKGAGGIQHLLDDIRAQFGCAILLESHVGKSGNDPRGAADWGYWPELGYTLARRAKDGTSFNLRPFRPPRFASMYQWIPTEYVSGPRHMRFRAMWEDGSPVPDDGDPRPLWDREPDWADNQIPHEPF